jgi:two-component system NtrC family response regulator
VRILGAHAERAEVIRASGTSIGRTDQRATSDVTLDDPRMSRQHVVIEKSESGWNVRDAGSRNGSFIDGRSCGPDERTTLVDGAVLRLGSSVLVFRATPPHDDGHSLARAFPGVSPPAVEIRRKLALRLAASGHVLVLGETGTGKERVAGAFAEARPGKPFVVQNCAELTRDLARSELFGHVRGAFSGATQNKPGLVDLAGDGVLFLDEIGELPLEVQADLLRFLEDGCYRPLGGGEVRRSAARVVAATNVDLDQAVNATKFRRDLLARLRASNEPLELPPLRERREDIPFWSRLFVEELGRPMPAQLWTAGALECLLLYPWPENLRELRGIVRGAMLEATELPLGTDRLPVKIRSHREALRMRASVTPAPRAEPSRRDPTKIEIEDALRRTRGRMRAAAIELQIDRRRLYRLCERFEIVVDEHRGTLDEE